MKLREYQTQAVEELYRKLCISSTALCVLPCGAGKTLIFMELIRKCMEKYPALKAVVLFDNIELLKQTKVRFDEFFGSSKVGVYSASVQKDCTFPLTLASVQSCFDVNFGQVQLIICDECHHLNQNWGRYAEFFKLQQTVNPKLKIVGFTATAFRTGTGVIYGQGKLFDAIDYTKSLLWMIENGYSVRPVLKQPEHQFDTSKLHTKMGDFDQREVEALTGDEAKVNRQILDALPRMQGRKKVIWFCSSINHAESVNRKLKALYEDSEVIHSKQERDVRDKVMQDFRQGALRHLVFITIIKEGVDVPEADCCVFMRPTKSAILFLQVSGRIMRPFPGKETALILDYGRVVETLGTLDNPKIFYTGAAKENKKLLESQRVRTCAKCYSYVDIKLLACPDCGYVFPVKISVQNLTAKAREFGDLLGYAKKEYCSEVRSVNISKYMSKANNLCLKIAYEIDNLLNPYINEFFIWNNDVGYKKVQKRLIDFETPLHSDIESQAKEIVKRVPKQIYYTLDKYPRIERMVF